jgi:hypothetical protein
MTKQVGDTTKEVGGPDELRELADRLLTGGSNYLLLRNRLYALADAWEAEIDLMNQSYHTLSVAYNATCKRLEAAEKLPQPLDRQTARHLAQMIEANRVFSPYRDCGIRLKAFGKWLAALAGEKP